MPNEEIEELEKKVIELQKKIYDKKIPILILMETNLKNKRSLRKEIHKVVLNFDPRDYKLYSFKEIYKKKYLRFFPFWKRIPSYGKITIFEGSYYKFFFKSIKQTSIKDIEYFEKLLYDENYQFIKILIHNPKKIQNKFLKIIHQTNYPFAKWNLIPYQKNSFLKEIYKVLLNYFSVFLESKKEDLIPETRLKNQTETNQKEYLKKISLNQKLTEEQYKKQLKYYTEKLAKLQKQLINRKIPMILLFEGWDASGKGGLIRRLVKSFDPRYYELVSISAPNEREKSYHYLWRFWVQLPEKGHILIFDRTWYGRVLVERVEKFCNEIQWNRAYHEINELERILTKESILLKFWLHIDKETQYKRFIERQNTPHKQWKITEEDWRNRDKWDLYENAIEEMFRKTDTKYCPWHIIEFNYKWFGRIKVFKTIIDAIKEKL
ncbi:MAG: hypothetical protein ACK4UJ_12100 [Leptonema sp. (in: bacteria)]